MSRSTYNPKETYTGTGVLAEYTFEFKINSPQHLLVIEVDNEGLETQRVRGDDNTFLSSVVYDAVNGGGTVTLAANLPVDHTLILLLANDEPLQEYEFRNKSSFTLRRFEDALDVIVGAIQRLTYGTKQAFKLHDLDDEETFNTQLPPGIAGQANRVLKVNDAGNGFTFGPLVTEVGNAQAYAEAAALHAEAAALYAEVVQVDVTDLSDRLDDLENALQVVESKNVNFQAEHNRVYLVSGEISVQLPPPSNGFIFKVKLLGEDNVTLVRNGTESIDMELENYLISSAKQSITIVSNGVDWFII